MPNAKSNGNLFLIYERILLNFFKKNRRHPRYVYVATDTELILADPEKDKINEVFRQKLAVNFSRKRGKVRDFFSTQFSTDRAIGNFGGSASYSKMRVL